MYGSKLFGHIRRDIAVYDTFIEALRLIADTVIPGELIYPEIDISFCIIACGIILHSLNIGIVSDTKSGRLLSVFQLTDILADKVRENRLHRSTVSDKVMKNTEQNKFRAGADKMYPIQRDVKQRSDPLVPDAGNKLLCFLFISRNGLLLKTDRLSGAYQHIA